MSAEVEKNNEKSRFLRNERPFLYARIGHEMLDRLDVYSPQQITYSDERTIDCSVLTLRHVTYPLVSYAAEIGREWKDIAKNGSDELFNAEIIPKKIFQYGLDDLHFAFHFIPIVVKDMLLETQQELGMTDDERKSLSLMDYASIMRESWFKQILTDTARTRNGVWGQAGYWISEYSDTEVSLKNRVSSYLDKEEIAPGYWNGETLFQVDKEQQEVDGECRYVMRISLDDSFRKELRLLLRGQDSVGCPAAFHTGSVNNIEDDPDVEYLIAAGHAKVVAGSRSKTSVEHIRTAVDRSADVTADYLERYVEHYGEPICNVDT